MATHRTEGQHMVINLRPELANAVEAEADRRGTTAEVVAIQCLEERFAPRAAAQDNGGSATMADYLAEFIGVIDTSQLVPGGARLSEKNGSDFANLMRAKKTQGKL
jgi:hypothetical protein